MSLKNTKEQMPTLVIEHLGDSSILIRARSVSKSGMNIFNPKFFARHIQFSFLLFSCAHNSMDEAHLYM